MKINYYISFKEALSYWYTNDYSSYDDDSNLKISSSVLPTFVTFLVNQLGTSARELNFIEENEGTYSLNAYAEDLIEYVIRRYGRYQITCVKNIASPNSELLEWLDQFINVLSMTFDKYSLLLSLYETNKAKLIDSIKEIEGVEATSSATSNSRFNDTPQNYQGQESYNDDGYSTNQGYSASTGGSEVTTTRTKDTSYLVEKLSLLEKSYLNLLLRWSNEFKNLFFIERGLKEVEDEE